MTPTRTLSVRRFSRIAGLGLVTAIFLLVILAGLAVAMVTLSTTQSSSTTIDSLSARAYQAARAGVQFGLYQQRRTGACPDKPTNITSMPGTLSGFTVTVQCRQTKTSDDTPQLDRYQIRATACNVTQGACPQPSNSADYVQRVIVVEY